MKLKSLDNINIINLDKETYSGNLNNYKNSKFFNLKYIRGSINDYELVNKILNENQIQLVVHFAAESHVDRSIRNPDQFMSTNIMGTYELLKASKNYWENKNLKKNFRFIHVSTDEVYGSLKLSDPAFNENNLYLPNSPYAASKAASDLIVRSYTETFGFPVIITNCSNNYGPFQYPEKLIPLTINNCLEYKTIPIYGDGMQIRDWIYVNDHCSALLKIIEKGKVGEKYNIGGNQEITNLELVKKICDILNELKPNKIGKYQDLISFVKDRPGHDIRYSINNTKISNELNWNPSTKLQDGLIQTIQWYLDNKIWLNDLKNKNYQTWINDNYHYR